MDLKEEEVEEEEVEEEEEIGKSSEVKDGDQVCHRERKQLTFRPHPLKSIHHC